jgi:MYXO-CTERM domain-containing protein
MQWSTMRMTFFVIGIAAVLMGGLWICQGLGFVDWPASSFMLDQRPWVTRGAFLALLGLVLVAASRRRA